jgi:hypothetical protein
MGRFVQYHPVPVTSNQWVHLRADLDLVPKREILVLQGNFPCHAADLLTASKTRSYSVVPECTFRMAVV